MPISIDPRWDLTSRQRSVILEANAIEQYQTELLGRKEWTVKIPAKK